MSWRLAIEVVIVSSDIRAATKYPKYQAANGVIRSPANFTRSAQGKKKKEKKTTETLRCFHSNTQSLEFSLTLLHKLAILFLIYCVNHSIQRCSNRVFVPLPALTTPFFSKTFIFKQNPSPRLPSIHTHNTMKKHEVQLYPKFWL